MTESEAIAAHGGPLHLPGNVPPLPAPVTRLQVVGYGEEACGPVTSPLAF